MTTVSAGNASVLQESKISTSSLPEREEKEGNGSLKNPGLKGSLWNQKWFFKVAWFGRFFEAPLWVH